MPSPAPVKPSFSSVVAFTFTRSGVTPIRRARLSRMAGMWGASFGRWARTVASTLPTRYPAVRSRSITASSRTRLSAPA